MNNHFDRINKFAYSDDCDCYDSVEAFNKCCAPKYGFNSLEQAIAGLLIYTLNDAGPRFKDLPLNKQLKILNKVNNNE